MVGTDSQAPRILIIRRDNIGDLVCTTPLIDALRSRFPKGWIGAFVNTYNQEVLARNPSLDAVFAYEKLKHHRGGAILRTMLETTRMIGRLRREKLDYALVPSATPRALRIAKGVSAKQTLSADASQHEGKHEVERTFLLAAPLGIFGTPGPTKVYPDPSIRERLRKDISSKAIAVHISARRPAQRWPLERYVELISELKKKSQVVLLWAPGPKNDPRHPGDDEAAREIASKTGCTVIPTPDLATLIAALSLCREVICPDGGAMHLAAALAKPIVALFGDSPVERWHPWGVPYKIVRPTSKNVADLPLQEVLAAHVSLSDK